jgi:hypothetical protein
LVTALGTEKNFEAFEGSEGVGEEEALESETVSIPDRFWIVMILD